ncbi:MAG: hypothetical protein U1B94_09560, partial [candidate division NC10 bacterium]|nr:hypothetical protein [candidate division NC10 bacterium]
IRTFCELKAVLGPGVVGGLADPTLEIAFRNAADSFGAYQPWTIGQVEARYIKYRITQLSADGLIRVDRMVPTADLIERTEKAVGVPIAAGGTQITFGKQYHRKPSVQITVEGATALIATAENIATTGFKGHVFNTGGTNVGGTVTHEAVGV